MQWLAALCVRRPVFATVLILSLTVVGAFSFTKLGVDQFPKVDFPTVVITTIQPGAAPEQIETEITDKIEEAVNTVSGIDELRSTSSEGVSIVFVSFLLEKNSDVAAQEVRDKVNSALPLLPRNIDQPRVEKFDPDSAPVLSISVSAKKPVRDVTEFVDKVVRRQLESVSGVGQVLILGGRERQINVWLDADRLRAYNLTVNDVSRALQAQNVEVPGGRVDQGSQSVTLRTRGRVQSVAEFNDIVVREQGGHAVRIADIAQVEDGEAEPDTIANINGTATVLLQVRRQSGTNTVEVVEAVLERLEEVKATLPAGYTARVVQDRSDFIKASIRSVEEHLIVGSILAALVVLVFLANLRSTIIAAIAIPTSIIASFGLVWFMGFTLNSMTMLALTLAVGIVIDDAIVVLENIYRFIEEKKLDHARAAIEATEEIGLAVLATTLSLVAIFVPVAFMGGIVGRFMQSFGLTMAFAILVSMLVSFTLTPMLAARWLKVAAPGADQHSSKNSRFFRGDRPGLHDDARVGDVASTDRRRGRGAGAGVERAALHDGEQELPAPGRPGRVRNHPAGAGRHQSGKHRAHHQPDRERRARRRARSGLHADHHRRRPGQDPQPGVGLREADRARQAQARSVRDHEHRPQRYPAAAGGRTANGGAAGRDHRRRRRAERRRAVPDQRTRPEDARNDRQSTRREGQIGARGRRRRLNVERRQARAVDPARSAQGVRPRRADRRCRRSPPSPGRRRPGDDLQRRQRAVRGAPAGAGAESLDRAGHRRADRAVVQAGQRRAEQHRDVLVGHRAIGHQPPRPAAAGHHHAPTCCRTGRSRPCRMPSPTSSPS